MKKKNELSEVEKGFKSPWPVLDELEHEAYSDDPLIKERALRTVREKFRLEFNKEMNSYRVVLKGVGIPANEKGYETISTNCNIQEYSILYNLMIAFKLSFTMENLKAVFSYGRNHIKALNILSNNPDANDEIRAYELVKKSIGFLSKIFDVNYPERLPFHVSTFSPKETFSFLKESLR